MPQLVHRFVLASVLLFAAGLLAGCQLTRDFTDVELAAERCDAGVRVECECGGGRIGLQECRPDGTFGECRCGADADIDAKDGAEAGQSDAAESGESDEN